MLLQPHAHEHHQWPDALAAWIADVALLAIVFSAAAILAAIILFFVVI